MTKSWTRIFPFIAVLALAVAGCETTSDPSIGGDYSASSSSAAAAPTPTRSYGSLEHNSSRFDESTARPGCVNDLQIYEAYLQAPDLPAKNLRKPVQDYIRDAGGAQEAITAANVDLTSLNVQLERELASRNPFDAAARARSDDNIARIEDGILLNEALIEALQCHL